MGLIQLDHARIGFWMAEQTARPELPAGLVPHEIGTPLPQGSTLVLVGADAEGRPSWSVLLHAAHGASVLVVWQGHLIVGLGERWVTLDAHGRVLRSEVLPPLDGSPDELLALWPLDDELLLLSRAGAHLHTASESRWTTRLHAAGHHLLGATPTHLTLAALDAHDWHTLVVDRATGTIADTAS